MLANREHGKTKMTWQESLLIPLPDVVPMRGQMEDSGHCCGFIITKKSVTNWRVAEHGIFQLNERKMQIRRTVQAPLSVYIHLCETRAAERSSRSEAAKQYRRKRGEERRHEKRKKQKPTFEV